MDIWNNTKKMNFQSSKNNETRQYINQFCSQQEDKFTAGDIDSKYSTNKNLAFEEFSIKYYPEDEKKMSLMSIAEKIEFATELKRQGKFFVIPKQAD
ncbi:MAG: hypothetical protein E7Z88_06480 [Cyanobacteria bacterium SIG27]|nr:hypothetical protein [Cyanobacteria bacterium SIG27]